MTKEFQEFLKEGAELTDETLLKTALKIFKISDLTATLDQKKSFTVKFRNDEKTVIYSKDVLRLEKQTGFKLHSTKTTRFNTEFFFKS